MTNSAITRMEITEGTTTTKKNESVTRKGTIRVVKMYERASLLPALARVGGQLSLTEEPDGQWSMEFSSDDLPNSDLRFRGRWYRFKANVDGMERKVDFLIGGFQHIHPMIAVGLCWDDGQGLTLHAWTWGLDNFIVDLMPLLSRNMEENVVKTARALNEPGADEMGQMHDR